MENIHTDVRMERVNFGYKSWGAILQRPVTSNTIGVNLRHKKKRCVMVSTLPYPEHLHQLHSPTDTRQPQNDCNQLQKTKDVTINRKGTRDKRKRPHSTTRDINMSSL